MHAFWEIAAIFFLSSVKFLPAPSSAIAMGFTPLQTILITTIGGSVGVFFFYFIEHWIFHIVTIFWRRKHPVEKKKKRLFNRRNRWIVKIKKKYGLIGVAIITPTLISIPIGTLIAAKYFKNKYQTLSYLMISVFGWSVLLTVISHFFKIGIGK